MFAQLRSRYHYDHLNFGFFIFYVEDFRFL